MIAFITINILFGPESWGERRDLLAEGLSAAQPDCILAQEVWESARDWLANRLAMPHVFWVPYQRPSNRPGLQDGIALFSRHPFIRQEMLLLSEGHGWVAQRVEIVPTGLPLLVCNGHYYWHPGPHPERDRQVARLIDWLAPFSETMPIVVGGDFNATPDTSAIATLRRHYAEAYAAHHGEEPRFTCPTPLSFDWDRPWRGTLDYLFVNSRLRVLDCRVILDRPLLHNPRIYPSDHLGILARLDILS